MIRPGDSLVKIVRCNWCTRAVGGVDHDGRCTGCRARTLLTADEQLVLAAVRKLASGRRLGLTVSQVQDEACLSRHTTYVRLKVLREHGFVDWDADRSATIHLTRGLG